MMRTASQILAKNRIARAGNKSAYTATCPQCSDGRAKKTVKCLSIVIDDRGVRGFCHHCNWRLVEFFNPLDDGNANGAAASPQTSSNDDAARIKRACTIWGEARNPTSTLVEVYLANRGLRLIDDVAGHAVRFHPAVPWKDDDDQLVRVPAMVATMRDVRTDELRAVQVTALKADGAKVMRKIRGVAAGSCIKLSADEDVTMGLGICEGLEDGLAILLDGWAPVWVAGSASAISKFPILGGVEALTIFADADAAGQGAARECCGRWRDAGREASILPPSRRIP